MFKTLIVYAHLLAACVAVGILLMQDLLHYYSFPRVTSRRGLLGLPTFEQILVVLTGALSTTSWLFACYLGIARPWNYTVDFSFVMFIYSGLLVTAFIVAGEVLRAMRKAEPEQPLIAEQIHLNAVLPGCIHSFHSGLCWLPVCGQ